MSYANVLFCKIGVGGEMGWGVIGETLSTKIDLLVQTMHFVLAKVVAAKVKSGKVNNSRILSFSCIYYIMGV